MDASKFKSPNGGARVKLDKDIPLKSIKEGWLLKQSKKLKTWQKRYFILDNVALYYCKSPTSVPDGFFVIRKCQFHLEKESLCFDVITAERVFRMKVPQGENELMEWASCYKGAMEASDFPYFHVEQTATLDISRELLLGVMSRGIRLVKLGLYDPGFEEEIAFFTFQDLESWGASDLKTFEFKVAGDATTYSFDTMHAQDIESKLEARFERWREWSAFQQHQKSAHQHEPLCEREAPSVPEEEVKGPNPNAEVGGAYIPDADRCADGNLPDGVSLSARSSRTEAPAISAGRGFASQFRQKCSVSASVPQPAAPGDSVPQLRYKV